MIKRSDVEKRFKNDISLYAGFGLLLNYLFLKKHFQFEDYNINQL